jgi:hypothetical protein
MSSAAKRYRQELGEELSRALGTDFSFRRTTLTLVAPFREGTRIITLAGTSRNSPYITIAFYMGLVFDVVREVEKTLTWKPLATHVTQFSVNFPNMPGISWHGSAMLPVDLRSPPVNLGTEVVGAVKAIAFPFFERLGTPTAARDAIASGSRLCFSGAPFWKQLFLLDCALCQLSHYEEWSTRLDGSQQRESRESITLARKVIPDAG